MSTNGEIPGSHEQDKQFGNPVDLEQSLGQRAAANELDDQPHHETGVTQDGTVESRTNEAATTKSFEVQKAEYQQSHELPKGEVLRFQLSEGFIAYNPSHVIKQTFAGESVDCIAARVEKVGEELSSTVKFFRKSADDQGDVWIEVQGDRVKIFETPPLIENDEAQASVRIAEKDKGTSLDAPFGPVSYQDPAIATGKLGTTDFMVVAVVKAQELHRVDATPNERRSQYHQEFWAGPSIDKLEKLADGPNSRKGTRLVSLGNNKWGVFNRPQSPQGEQFGPGKITYSEFQATTPAEFNSGLTSAITKTDVVVPGLCIDGEWVGPNQGWPLADGRIGMIGHLARMTNVATGAREYCASSFIYDPQSNSTQNVQIIATKASFGDVNPRPDRQDLNEVLYPGGANILPDGKLRLYCGVSDNAAGCVDVTDPFEGLRA